MGDYLTVIYHAPLYLFHVLELVWGAVHDLPWPSKGDIFGSFVIFIILWYPRHFLEKRLSKPYRRSKRTGAPTESDHQSAAASIGNIFGHH